MTDDFAAFKAFRQERSVCPRCGAPGVHIVRGYPTPEAYEAEIAGDIVLGGCLVGSDDPDWECTACHRPFSGVGASGTIPTPGMLWEDCAVFPDCAFAALGDPALLADAAWLAHERLPFLQVRRSGLGMLCGKAECDDLVVELGRIGGQVAAARLEFTNDVAELDAAREGQWIAQGRLRIGSRGAIAVDKNHQGSAAWRRRLPLPAAWYRAEAFRWERDHLGIRLIAEDVRG